MGRLLRYTVTILVVAMGGIPLQGIGSEAPITRVFILSGQSNCEGAGNGDLLPSEYKILDSQAMIFSRWTKHQWVPLAPYRRTEEQFNISETAFGPELGFGREMRKAFPEDSIFIIKQAFGGTSVVAWDRNHGTEEYIAQMKEAGHISAGKSDRLPQYPILLKTIKDALAQIDQPYEVSGFLWFQAEADAKTDRLAEKWAGRVTDLLDNLAEDVGFSKDVPLMVMDPHFFSNNNTDGPYGKKVVAALLDYAKTGESFSVKDLQVASGLEPLSSTEFMKSFCAATGRGPGVLESMALTSKMKRDIRAIASERPRTAVIPVDDLATYEGVHFDTEGQLEIGKRLVEAFKGTR